MSIYDCKHARFEKARKMAGRPDQDISEDSLLVKYCITIKRVKNMAIPDDLNR
jgi:hypothetical protein